MVVRNYRPSTAPRRRPVSAPAMITDSQSASPSFRLSHTRGLGRALVPVAPAPSTLPLVPAQRRACPQDVHDLAAAMPHVTVRSGRHGNRVYDVGGRSFVFFRNPRPDAVDPATGERYDDVIVIWVPSEADKQALVQDPASPFFTTAHFDGHPSVLVRASRLCELSRQELAEVIEDAWVARASSRRAAAWLRSRGFPVGSDRAAQPRE